MLCGAALMLVAGSASPASSEASAGGTAASAPRTAADEEGHLVDAESTLKALDGALDGTSHGATPIDLASRARAACLSALTFVRRRQASVSRAPGAGDALLVELSRASMDPSRDDRGIVVTVRDAWSKGGLNASARARIDTLARAAATHPAFPIEVVVHQDRDGAKARVSAERLAGAVRGALENAGVVHVSTILAGVSAPLVEHSPRNARVELVFVAPESF